MSGEGVTSDLDVRLGFVRGRPRPMARLRDWQRNVVMWPSTVSDQGKAVCFLCRSTEYPPDDTATFLYPADWYSVNAEQDGSHGEPARRDLGDVPICPRCARILNERAAALGSE